MRLVFAIPDHPWLKGAERAAVRIAMTVAERGEPDGEGRLLTVTSEAGLNTDAPRIELRERRGVIGPDLTLGGDMAGTSELKANGGLAHRGVQLSGNGFMVTAAKARALLRSSDDKESSPLRRYRNGRDLTHRSRDLLVIDLLGWSENEARRRHPGVYQHLLETVKPDRDRNNRPALRDNWWIFGEPRKEMRAPLEGLSRFIVTVETSKHRWFRFLDGAVLPDNKLVAIASDDARVLGVLSSRLHRSWASRRGGRLEDRPVYVKSACFDAFPFPDLEGAPAAELGALAEELDALRARVLADHPDLTMTGLYNACDRLASGAPLTDLEREVCDRGLIRLLAHLHRRIDQQAALAYGWPADLDDGAAVAALARLNRERAEEEARGVVRFLRPDYQATRVAVAARPVQIEAALSSPAGRPALPQTPEALASALLACLRRSGTPVGAESLAARFDGGSRRTRDARVREMLAVLAVAGSVQQTQAGWFAAVRRG